MKNKLITYLQNITNLQDINLSTPPNPSMGDYAFAVFPLAKREKKNPNQIAMDLKEKIQQNLPDFIEKVEQIGPYLNFFLSKSSYAELLESISTNLEKEENKQKTIFIDYI